MRGYIDVGEYRRCAKQDGTQKKEANGLSESFYAAVTTSMPKD
jgi:hypothetical protein